MELPSIGLFSDCRTRKLLSGHEWLSQRWTLSIFQGWNKVHRPRHPLFLSEASNHPWVSSHVDYTALPGAHSPAPAGQKGTSGMTFWSRCKESITVAPQLRSHISSVRITTAMRFKGRWPRAWPRLLCNLLSGRLEQKRWRRHTCPCTHTHTHKNRGAIWPRNIMRVINVSVKRVIDRWRGALSGSSIHNQRDIDDGVRATRAEAPWRSLYYDVPVTMSKLLPGVTEPSEWDSDEIVWAFMGKKKKKKFKKLSCPSLRPKILLMPFESCLFCLVWSAVMARCDYIRPLSRRGRQEEEHFVKCGGSYLETQQTFKELECLHQNCCSWEQSWRQTANVASLWTPPFTD